MLNRFHAIKVVGDPFLSYKNGKTFSTTALKIQLWSCILKYGKSHDCVTLGFVSVMQSVFKFDHKTVFES